MLRAFRSLLVLLAICSAPSVARAGDPVDLLLVFAADVSRSIDQPKFQLQREGYAAAIADKRVLEAITGAAVGRLSINGGQGVRMDAALPSLLRSLPGVRTVKVSMGKPWAG